LWLDFVALTPSPHLAFTTTLPLQPVHIRVVSLLSIDARAPPLLCTP
jgi:hypothetical protein